MKHQPFGIIYSGKGQRGNSQHVECCLYFWEITSEEMKEEQQKDLILGN